MLPSMWKKEDVFPFMGVRRGLDNLFENLFEERFSAVPGRTARTTFPRWTSVKRTRP
jgi:hypothetical protein